MRGDAKSLPALPPTVPERLRGVLGECSGPDEFVHGLFAFLEGLAQREPEHPVVGMLAADLGRTTSEALSAGLLHDLRTQLQILGTHLELLQADLGQVFDPSRLDPEARAQLLARFLDGVSASRDAAGNAAEMVRGGVGLVAERGDVTDLAEALDAALEFGRRMLPRRVEVAVDHQLDVRVRARRPDLLRTLFNLIRNAGDALRDHEAPRIVVRAWASRETAFVQVADNGPGIFETERGQVFDFLYTTKRHGTGVGLFVVKSLVEGWGGRKIGRAHV